MQNTIMEKIEEISRVFRREPSEIIAEAVEVGLSKLWADTVLREYLRKKISRRKAIHLVGLDLVRLAERQDKVVQNDIRWGINGKANHK